MEPAGADRLPRAGRRWGRAQPRAGASVPGDVGVRRPLSRAELEGLAQLVPLHVLAPKQLKSLAKEVEILELEPGTELGCDAGGDEWYLLAGELQLLSGTQVVDAVAGGEARARVSLLDRGNRWDIMRAEGAVRLLRFRRGTLNELLVHAKLAAGSGWSRLFPGATSDIGWALQLVASPLNTRVPAENVPRIFDCLEPVEVRSGETVIRQGDPGHDYYVVRRGRCVVSRSNDDGKSQ